MEQECVWDGAVTMQVAAQNLGLFRHGLHVASPLPAYAPCLAAELAEAWEKEFDLWRNSFDLLMGPVEGLSSKKQQSQLGQPPISIPPAV
jgi:hypothetical protein